jgi:hypothetical protein
MQPKTLFDHLNAIYTDKRMQYFDGLTDQDLKTYNQYMLNRFISMNPPQALLVDEIQSLGTIPNRMHYKYFSDALPSGKQFNKFIKSVSTKVYVDWVIELVATHYEISRRDAIDYLDIYYSQNKFALIELCTMYGKTPKEIKELRL